MNYKNRYLLCMAWLCLGSCSSYRPIYKKREFVRSYKQVAQFFYLDEISDGKLKMVLRNKQDVSLVPQAEIIGDYYYSQVDSFARKKASEIQPLVPDETDDFYSSKAYFNDYLNFTSSRSLDSIAKLSYRGYKKRICSFKATN